MPPAAYATARLVALAGALALASAARADEPAAPTPPAAHSPPAAPGAPKAGASPTSTIDLAPLLEPIRAARGLPALAAAVVRDGRVIAAGATGLRKADAAVRVTLDDRFHIGSCTKAMTATLCAILVEEGTLRWDLTLAEAFPEHAEAMAEPLRKATLEHLLTNRSGLSGRSWPDGRSFLDMHRLPGPPVEQRRAYAAAMLREAPEAEPGTRNTYSNANFALAGIMAERAAGKPYEALMQERLFAPLGIRGAGFGAAGTPGEVDQPWQHRFADGKAVPLGPGPLSDNPPVIAPAGTVHLPIADWARFAAAHLDGRRGRPSLLPRAAFEHLHAPPAGESYAFGWGTCERPWGGGTVLTHAGSNNQNFAVVWVAPLRDFAVVIATNQGHGEAPAGCDQAAWELIRRFLLGER